MVKEVIDNSIDEFVMGAGKTIEVSVQASKVTVRDYGRGIPLGKLIDVVSKMNTGGKYDTRAFKKAVGLNGVGTKAVNALSDFFKVESNRDGKTAYAESKRGELDTQIEPEDSSRRRGTKVTFIPDLSIFKNFKFRNEYIARMLKNYVYLNPGLTIIFNNEKFHSKNGLKDLLEERIKEFNSYTAKVILMPMQALGACHGPFDTIQKAQKMAANDLGENDTDYFGVKWCFVECEMKVRKGSKSEV